MLGAALGAGFFTKKNRDCSKGRVFKADEKWQQRIASPAETEQFLHSAVFLSLSGGQRHDAHKARMRTAFRSSNKASESFLDVLACGSDKVRMLFGSVLFVLHAI